MLVKLYDMPVIDPDMRMDAKGIVIKRAMALDKDIVTDFVRDNFGDYCAGWAGECERAILNNPPSCYIAVRDKELVGFACYDASALGFFGPIGVLKAIRSKGVGKALLVRCLQSMKEKGYAYAIIRYAVDAIRFYENAVGAVVIEGSIPEKSIYFNRISDV